MREVRWSGEDDGVVGAMLAALLRFEEVYP